MPRKWTNSSLGTVLFCGPKYDFKYEQKIRVPTRPRLVRGSTVHEMARLTMRRRQNQDVVAVIEEQRPINAPALQQLRTIQGTRPGTLPEVEEIEDRAAADFEKRWTEQEVDCRDEELQGDALKAATKDTAIVLATVHREKLAPSIEPLGVELRVTVKPKASDIEVEGTIDLVSMEEVAGYRIRDTKTSEKAPSGSMADDSPQFDMYSLIGLAKFGALPDDLRLDHVWQTPKNKERKFVSQPTTRDMDDITALINRINAATLAVDKGILVPAPSDNWMCLSCEYREPRAGFAGCPYVRRGDRRPTN